jgi:Kef-type K+ transport system membrane component KefB/CBS domain-containing protein
LAITPGPGLLFGLMLLAAIVGGHAAKSVHVPRVIGYVLGGLALRWMLVALLPAVGSEDAIEPRLDEAAAPLRAVKDLALGLILFSIGQAFRQEYLRTDGVRALRISATEIGWVVASLLVGCLTVGLVSGIAADRWDVVVLGILLALAGIETAPAATFMVLQEYGAKGPMTDLILTLTALNNVACIVLFHGAFLGLCALEMIHSGSGVGDHLWLGLSLTIAGSVAVGVIFGAALSIVHVKLPLSESLLIFLAAFIVLGQGEKWLLAHNDGLSFNFLLVSIVIGAVFANVAVDSQKLEGALRTVGQPLFAAFFVMAGFELHLQDLRGIGWIGGAYLIARAIGKIIGCRMGARGSGLKLRAMDRLGPAMLCQAAIAIGLASFVQTNWNHPLAKTFGTVLLGSIVVFELLGPLFIKRCVVSAGEVKAITLIRSPTDAGKKSAVALTVESLMGLVGLGPGRRSGRAREELKVRHIMRRSAQLLHAGDNFDEVLHFIERSRHNAFPVAGEDGSFVGSIKLADVRELIYDPAFRDLVTAIDLADVSAPIVAMDMPLEELLALFHREHVGVLPVCESETSRRIVGIVEERDLLAALHRSMA